jgi:rsbT co-antagonist protein RsbR
MRMALAKSSLVSLLSRAEEQILREWTEEQRSTILRRSRVSESEFLAQCRSILDLVREAAGRPDYWELNIGDLEASGQVLGGLSEDWVTRGFNPSEIARFVLSLKRPVFKLLREQFKDDPGQLGDETWKATMLFDNVALFITEIYQKANEGVIRRQQHELLELSTPVVRLWDHVLALPLIGTLDSARTQVVMQTLLDQLIETDSNMAIIDITGVPTVDTLVAQHLLRTVEAARLMGAECIISGIRPQIAQTIVALGVEMTVTTKATLADALKLALERQGLVVGKKS